VHYGECAFGIERSGGFVGEDDRRMVGERAGDGDALLLSTGKLRDLRAGAREVSSGGLRAVNAATRGKCVGRHNAG